MIFKKVCLESIVSFLPDEIVTSDQIEQKLAPVYKRLKLPFGRLELMSGIQKRRFWQKGSMPSDSASKAGELAIDQSGIDKKDIGCLVNSSVCRDFLEPATASVVHEKMSLNEDTLIFDISNACLGFLNGMIAVSNMIENNLIKAGIIVAGENSRPLVESTIQTLLKDDTLTRKTIKGSFASLTIGSGAAAAVLTHSSISKTKHFLMGGAYLVSSKFNDLCRGGQSGSDAGVSDHAQLLMNTDAEKLLHAGCELAAKTWEKTKSVLNICNDNVKRFFCHQVGSVHRKLMYKTLGIDIEKDFPTFHKYGNMGSVSLPATLADGVKENVVQKGDIISLLGIGSGINSMMLGIKW